jgi:hypothetical protein
MPLYDKTVPSLRAVKMQIAEVLSTDATLCENCSLSTRSKDVNRRKFEILET